MSKKDLKLEDVYDMEGVKIDEVKLKAQTVETPMTDSHVAFYEWAQKNGLKRMGQVNI